ncbi:MAG: hypothetical protein ABSD32_22765 [Mycobacterium sp.]|jgi:hypothetical protein
MKVKDGAIGPARKWFKRDGWDTPQLVCNARDRFQAERAVTNPRAFLVDLGWPRAKVVVERLQQL